MVKDSLQAVVPGLLAIGPSRENLWDDAQR